MLGTYPHVSRPLFLTPMKRFFLGLTCLAITTGATTTHAQGARIGLGIGLTSGSFNNDGFDLEGLLAPTSIYVPITFTKFRLEPEIGILKGSSSSDGGGEASGTILQIGTGVFALKTSGDVNTYFGGRVGITKMSSKSEFLSSTYKTTQTNFFIGPVVGAEHMFGSRLSLGGEAQLLYTSIGDEEVDGDPNAGSDVSTSLIRTRAVFFVRWKL
jgi:hypothetical protein